MYTLISMIQLNTNIIIISSSINIINNYIKLKQHSCIY